MKLSLSRKVLTLIVIPLVFDLALISALFFALQRADQEAERLSNARSTVAVVDDLLKRVLEATTLAIRKRLGIGFEPEHEKTLKEDLDQFSIGLDRLEKLSKNSQQRVRYKEVIEKARKLHAAFQLESRTEDSGFMHALAAFKELEPMAISLSDQLNEATRIESKTVQKLVQEDARIRQSIRQLIGAGFGINVLLAVLLTTAFNKDISLRLARLMHNVQKLPENGDFGRPTGGSDEIALLDEVLRKVAADLADAREKERFLLDNMPVAILTVDRDNSTVLSANPAAEELFHREGADLRGKKLDDFLIVPDMQALAKSDFQELKLRQPDRDCWAETLVRDFEDLRLVALLDVSERIRIRRQREQFVAMVSHDLRTPLTSIQASLELVSAGSYGSLSSEGLIQMDRAESNVERLIKLINDLLALEKIESAGFPVDARRIDLDSVVEKALEAVLGAAGQASVSIKYSSSKLLCLGDYDRLVQVLVNLLGNAIKFSNEHSSVEIESEKIGTDLEVRVIDHGPGISENMRNRIFDRFVQAEDSGQKTGGTGLGLAICKAIIEQHNGSIGVRSIEEKGSTFWFRIPLEEN